MRRRTALAVCMPLALLLASCGDDDDTTTTAEPVEDTSTVPDGDQPAEGEAALPTPGCDDAFDQAASVDKMQDTVEDLYPAARACESLEDWIAASERHPDAIEDADPEVFARNVCMYGEDVTDSLLCQELGS